MIKSITVFQPRSPEDRKKVIARVIGPLAYHKSINPNPSPDKAFTVTHIRTGMVVTSTTTREMARALAERLAIDPDLCWNFGNFPESTDFTLPKPGKLYRDRVNEIKALIVANTGLYGPSSPPDSSEEELSLEEAERIYPR